MSPWQFMTERWPDRAFSIRRRMKSDACFREIIGDYEVARHALRHWYAQDPPGTQRIKDYEQIVRDLEEEIEAHLSLPVPVLHSDAPVVQDQKTHIRVPPSFQNPREHTP